jgi:hypothetical protein
MATDVEVAFDDANRADGDIGSNYTIPTGLHAPVINGGRFQKGSGRCEALWTGDDFDDDQFAGVTMALVHNCARNSSGDVLGGGIGVALRGSLGGDGYFVCGANDRTIVIARISGVDTVLYDDAPSWSDGDDLWAQIIGSTITVFRNDVQVAEVDASEAAIASGHPGLFFLGGNFGTLRLDDLSVGNMVSESSGIAADIDVTAAAAAVSSSGSMRISGAAGAGLPMLGASVSAKLAIAAAAAVEAPSPGCGVSGSLALRAEAAVSSPVPEADAAGALRIAGAAAVTTPDPEADAPASLAVRGTFDAEGPAATVEATGALRLTGAIAAVAPLPSVHAAGPLGSIAASVAAGLPMPGASAAAAMTIRAAAGVNTPAPSAAGAAALAVSASAAVAAAAPRAASTGALAVRSTVDVGTLAARADLAARLALAGTVSATTPFALVALRARQGSATPLPAVITSGTLELDEARYTLDVPTGRHELVGPAGTGYTLTFDE